MPALGPNHRRGDKDLKMGPQLRTTLHEKATGCEEPLPILYGVLIVCGKEAK